MKSEKILIIFKVNIEPLAPRCQFKWNKLANDERKKKPIYTGCLHYLLL